VPLHNGIHFGCDDTLYGGTATTRKMGTVSLVTGFVTVPNTAEALSASGGLSDLSRSCVCDLCPAGPYIKRIVLLTL